MTRLVRLVLLCLLAGLAAGAQAAITLPIEIEQNLVIVQVRIGQSPPLSFLVDTGASSTVIAEDRVADAGLAAGPAIAATAQGGDVEAALVHGAVLRIGPVSLSPDSVAAVDLSGLSAGLGRRIDGILGYELFARYVVRIDYDRRRMTLFEPGTAPMAGTQIPIEIRGGTAFAMATMTQGGEAVRARMLIDIGAASAATLYADFVGEHPTLVPADAIALTGGAILPGQFRARTGRLTALALGPFRFERPVVNFSSTGGGDDAAPGDAGQIGGELLSRFTATFDYGRGRMALAPSRRFRAPLGFDASGMSLRAEGEGFAVKRVRAILPGTPAEAAGLRPGDTVLRIDGSATARLSLGRIRALLRRPGHTYRLDLVRDGRAVSVRLTTRRLI